MVDALKAAAWTALWTFAGSLLVLSTGWLASVAQWASTSGHSPLPGLSTIGYAVVAAVVAAVSGAITGVVRAGQAKNYLPGQPPTYPHS